MLPFTFALPVTLKLPVKLANCVDNTNTFGVPLTANVILLALAGIRTLLDPFTIAVPTDGVTKLKLPAPSVLNTSPALPPGIFNASALDKFALPVIDKSPVILTLFDDTTTTLGTPVTPIVTFAFGLIETLLFPLAIWFDAGSVPQARFPVASAAIRILFAIPPVIFNLFISVLIFPVALIAPNTLIPKLDILSAVVPVATAIRFPF